MTAFVGLGANLGDVRAVLSAAVSALTAWPGCRLLAKSSLYRSSPVDAEGPDFLNAAVKLETLLTASALLAALQAIEEVHGRERPFLNAPRTLDLDLLLYGDERIDVPGLTVPHPRLSERAFVLLPLAEIDPGLNVPGRGRVADWLAAVAGQRIDQLQGPWG